MEVRMYSGYSVPAEDMFTNSTLYKSPPVHNPLSLSKVWVLLISRQGR